jgi:hypothetical protein
MSVNIEFKIGDNVYLLHSDKKQYIISRKIIVKKSKRYPNGTALINNQYYTKIENVFDTLVKMKIKDCDIQTFEELKKEIYNCQNNLINILNLKETKIE